MERSRHAWKSGVMFKTPAEEAYKVMSQLAQEDNLNAQALVDVSRPEEAVLHQDFEWRDEIAAEEYRKGTARNMINSIVIVREEQVDQEPIRAYFHIEHSNPNYEHVEIIMQDEDKSEKLFHLALRELTAFRAKYNSLKQFKKLFEDIDELQQQMLFEKGA